MTLTFERWRHISDEHGELHALRDDVLEAVATPDRRHPGTRDGEEWFYRLHVGPTVWIRVVVHFSHGQGRIVTAFPRRRFP